MWLTREELRDGLGGKFPRFFANCAPSLFLWQCQYDAIKQQLLTSDFQGSTSGSTKCFLGGGAGR